MKKIFFPLLFLATSIYAADFPDPTLTPGESRPFTKDQICAQTPHRDAVSQSLRAQVFKAYGMRGNRTGYCEISHGCEIDHLIPIELGGASTFKNLWPQPYTGNVNAHMKDQLENRLKKLVCTEQLSLEAAQHEIATDWLKTYNTYVKPVK